MSWGSQNEVRALAFLPCTMLRAVVPSWGAGWPCSITTASMQGGWKQALLGLNSSLSPQSHKAFCAFLVKRSENLSCANLNYEATQATQFRFDFSVTPVSTSCLMYTENSEHVAKFTCRPLAGEGREENLWLFHLISIPGLETKFMGLYHW